MGNKSSSSDHSSGSLDKGPFSDEEFDAIVQAFRSCESQTAKGKADVEAFVRLFSFPDPFVSSSSPGGNIFKKFPRRLYQVFAADNLTTKDTTSSFVDIRKFVNGITNCTRASSDTLLRTMISICDESGQGKLDEQILSDLFQLSYAMATVEDDDTPDQAFNFESSRFVKSVLDSDQTSVDIEGFQIWANRNTFWLHKTLDRYVRRKCMSQTKVGQSSFKLPSLAAGSDILDRKSVFGLCLSILEAQDEWCYLYKSTKDGLSFNRLCHHIFGYTGPTILVIRSTSGDVFGFFTKTPWKEGNTFGGSIDCMLFRLSPVHAVFPAKPTGAGNYMYLNTKGYSLPHGIGMGGNIPSFRLFLDEDFENCVARTSCLTFESGALTQKAEFYIDTMEVWGCGGEEALNAQASARKDRARLIENARKVDKAKFLGEHYCTLVEPLLQERVPNGVLAVSSKGEFDQEMFLGKTFAHKAEVDRSRADDEPRV